MAGSQNVLGRQCDTFVPVDIPNDSPIRLVSAGFQHQCLVSAEGELFTFGFNRKICCGCGSTGPFRTSTDYCGLSVLMQQILRWAAKRTSQVLTIVATLLMLSMETLMAMVSMKSL